MKKHIYAFVTAMLLCIVLCLPAFADGQQYVFDDTGVFTAEDIAELDALAEQIYQAHDFRVAFVRVDDATVYNAEDITDLLEAVYNEEYGSEDGIIIGCDNSYWNAYRSGSAVELFSDDDVDRIWNAYGANDSYVGGVKAYYATVEPYLDGELVVSPVIVEATTVKCDSRLNDMADLLTAEQEAALLARLDEISQQQDFDLVVVTADDLGGKYYVDYADDYFDYNNFGLGGGRDGALLLISMEPNNRKCYISTSGRGIDAFTDSTIESLLDVIVDEHLAYGEYYEAADSFVTLCDDKLTPPTVSELLPKWIGTALLIALVIAFIRIQSMKSQMKSVRSQAAANSYLDGDLNVTQASDIFLYHTVTRTKRESSSSSGGGSSSHHSSSGSSHGGGGRSF